MRGAVQIALEPLRIAVTPQLSQTTKVSTGSFARDSKPRVALQKVQINPKPKNQNSET
jgi:hypothetical protein